MWFVNLLQTIPEYFQHIWEELPAHSANPLEASLFIFVAGGWIPFAIAALWTLDHLWVELLEEHWEHHQPNVLLAIDVPRLNEQSPMAVENIFSTLWATGGKPDFIEKYFIGKSAPRFGFEIVSNAGHLQFYVHCREKLRDLVEATIYSQYPNAEIQEVEDYVSSVPARWPNGEYLLGGADLVLKEPQSFPLRTYPAFEHSLSQEFKDPLAAVIEAMNKLGQGEQIWFQIAITAADPDWKKRSEDLINKISGKPVIAHKTFFDTLAELPLLIVNINFHGW